MTLPTWPGEIPSHPLSLVCKLCTEEDQSLEEARAATKPKAVRRGHLWHPFQERRSPFGWLVETYFFMKDD